MIILNSFKCFHFKSKDLRGFRGVTIRDVKIYLLRVGTIFNIFRFTKLIENINRCVQY